MKWLKGITIVILLIGLSSLEFFAQPPTFDRFIPGAQLPTDRQSTLGLGAISVSYPHYKGLKTWTEIEYKYVKKPLWFDIFGIFGSRHYQVLEAKKIFQYDKAGREIESYHYSKGQPANLISPATSNYEVKSAYEYKYDDQGNLIEVLHNTNGTLYIRAVIKYDESGNKIAHIVYTGEPAKERFGFTYKHDQSGNGFERTIYSRYNDRDKVTDKRGYKFDEQENIIETIEYEKDGENVETRRTYKYDDKGQVIQIKEYNADGKTKVRNYKYNSHGDIIGRGYSYKYDRKGNIIERAYYSNTERRIVSKQTYKYDDQGNRIEETKYEIKQESGQDIAIPEEQTTYEYEFYPEESKEDK